MPLDSRAKRRSSTGILQPWRPSLPLPLDSPAVVDQADKQESAWTYSGILAVYTPAEQILVTGTWRVAPVLTGTWHDRDVCDRDVAGTAGTRWGLAVARAGSGRLDAAARGRGGLGCGRYGGRELSHALRLCRE